MMVGDMKSESSWNKSLSKLKDRGLHGVDIIVSPNSLNDEVHSHVQAMLEVPDEDKSPRTTSTLEDEFDDAAGVLLLHEKYGKRLRTTNTIERLNGGIRRREGVARVFLNKESVIRLATSYAHGKK